MESTLPAPHPVIQRYLTDLLTELQAVGSPAVDEALADAREFLASEWQSLRRREPDCPSDVLYNHFVRKFGSPSAVAAGYIEVDMQPSKTKASLPRWLSMHLWGISATLGALGIAVMGTYAWRVRAGEISTPVASLPYVTETQSIQKPVNKTMWAERVVHFRHGLGVGDAWLDPKGAIGKPDCDNCRAHPETIVSLGIGGELIVDFGENAFHDGDGDDLTIFEVGFVEPVRVAVSENGKTWFEIGTGQTRVNNFDLAEHGLSGRNFRQVKLTDGGGSAKSWRAGTPGVDIDAVGVRYVLPAK